VEPLAHNPRPDGSRKLQGSDDAYRIRVGDYRVIYTVDDAVHIVAWSGCATDWKFTAEIGEEHGPRSSHAQIMMR
jgi:hypothetical protein